MLTRGTLTGGRTDGLVVFNKGKREVLQWGRITVCKRSVWGLNTWVAALLEGQILT